MSSDSWPPKLKDWVAKCLGQMTDSNRTEAQAELRQVIADAFAAHTLWTTDWEGVQLKSLLPKPTPVFNNNLKRKSLDLPVSNKKAKKNAQKNASAAHTWDPNDQAALNRRAQRFQREHELERTKHLKANQNTTHLFKDMSISRSESPFGNADDPEADPNVIDWDRFTIVGTSQEIFKDYLRLTSEPKPEQIRPFAVLQQTLLELKKRWREKCSYDWICSQFKSLRQDLTVQRIKNDFTVQVYEIHARMALETGDMVEYNQCQATLKTLYELGIPGKVEEFTAYRILMLLHGRNRSELNLFVGQLTPRQKADPAVRHALAVQRALSMGNYHSLFDLYLNAPNMGAYIMDHFVDRERVKALMVITKAYKTIPLKFIHDALAFDSLDAARVFLVKHSAAFFTNPRDPDSQKILDCKPAIAQLSQVFEEKYRKVGIKGAI
ncbi:putative SAC3/GANP family protein [Lyophyllum shimeji]|uniref:SAC3/GANP family protein n=1 Tax=Lyophyllum shimeji TaxID=47721 RepID=A0A9P3PUB8_LYOSH|nr:putative SAC3/GANP family protein [Lyophyllum shimeji]